MFEFLLPSSLLPVVFHVVACVMILLAVGDPADGISWLAGPAEYTNVQQGLPFSLQWHYEMDENETFLDSDINFFAVFPLYPLTMASRHKGEKIYVKYQKKDINRFFSIFGKNNITLNIHSDKIGQNSTYCCVVRWRSEAGKGKDRRCSKVLLYAVPEIVHHIPQLSCKQGDSVKLKCNATGTPAPRVKWIHADTHELLERSSDTVLNITGKSSEGKYCCDANNGFGRKKACTAVNVTEYQPWNTMLLAKQTNKDGISSIHVKCKAYASPPSNNFIININDKEYNSSDGEITINVRRTRNNRIVETSVSCIPCNKYGQGPVKKVVLPLFVPPRFIAPIRTQYNMTVSAMTLKCNATGIPTPNITWTNEDTGDTVGTGKYYQVPYVTCATRTMTFYCHARNAVGNISSPEIHVNVMTEHNCITVDEGLDKTSQMSLKKLVLMISCIFGVLTGVVLIAILMIFWLRRNKNTRKDASSTIVISEDPYQDPIDAVVPRRDGSESLLERSNTTSTDEGYATVEEFAPRLKKQNVCYLIEDILYQEPLDAVVPERDKQEVIASRDVTSTDEGYATVEECGLKPRRGVKNTQDPSEDDSKYESLIEFATPSV